MRARACKLQKIRTFRASGNAGVLPVDRPLNQIFLRHPLILVAPQGNPGRAAQRIGKWAKMNNF